MDYGKTHATVTTVRGGACASVNQSSPAQLHDYYIQQSNVAELLKHPSLIATARRQAETTRLPDAPRFPQVTRGPEAQRAETGCSGTHPGSRRDTGARHLGLKLFTSLVGLCAAAALPRWLQQADAPLEAVLCESGGMCRNAQSLEEAAPVAARAVQRSTGIGAQRNAASFFAEACSQLGVRRGQP